MKPFWIIVRPNDTVEPWTVGATAEESIHKIERQSCLAWDNLQGLGYTCVQYEEVKS